MPSPFLNKRALGILLVIAVGILGLFASFKVTINIFGLIGDKSHAAVLWTGWHEYGWPFIKEFRYAKDNWLLSLVPVNFLAFSIFGVRPEILVLSGWLFFVANAVLCGLIARAFGARKTAAIVPVMLLFAGDNAHNLGLATHAFSHNGTNVYGLGILLCCVLWVKSRRLFLLGFVLLLSILAGVSDPWLLPTYILPIGIVSLLAVFVCKRDGNQAVYVKLFATILLAGFSIKTQCFGAFSFLPSFSFHFANFAGMRNNAFYFVRCLAGLFLVGPGNGVGSFIASLVSTLALLALMLGAVLLVARNQPLKRPVAWVGLSAILLSMGGIAAAFILSNVLADDGGGRFLINWLYLAPVLIAVALELNWDKASKFFKSAAVAATALFVLSGVSSNYQSLSTPGLAFNTKCFDEFTNFLGHNGLNYGYGAYEVALASPVSLFSNPRIIIRPVRFSKTTGYMAKGSGVSFSDNWYGAEAAPRDQREYFVVAKNDGQDSLDAKFYVDSLTRQFGPPSRTLEYNGSPILVWNHPLFDAFKPVSLGTKIPFGINAEPLNCSGWSAPQEWGVGSEEKSAFVKLELASRPAGDLELRIEGRSYVARKHPVQNMDVFVNDHWVGVLRYDSNDMVMKALRISAAVASEKEGRLLIQFQIKNPMSARGTRVRGLGLVSLQVNAVQP